MAIVIIISKEENDTEEKKILIKELFGKKNNNREITTHSSTKTLYIYFLHIQFERTCDVKEYFFLFVLLLTFKLMR